MRLTMRYCSLVLIVIVLLALCASDASPAGRVDTQSDFAARPTARRDAQADFAALHPEVANDEGFRFWTQSHPFGKWRELRRTPDDRQIVIVQEALGDSRVADDVSEIARAELFAAEIQYVGSIAFVKQWHPFLRKEVSGAYRDSKTANNQRRLDKTNDNKITIVQPAVSFGNVPKLTFQFDTFDLLRFGNRKAPPCTAGYRDGLSTNDLHHPRDRALSEEARRVVSNPSDVHRSARQLCHYVRLKVNYSSYGVLGVYTLSDRLIRQHFEGECDANAVLLVSYLRSLHIPARIKFVKWQRGGDQEDHACVEYMVNGVAFHLDPTRDVVNYPETYRKTPIYGFLPENIRVVDVDWPSDARSTADIGSYPDFDSTDGLLNPWGDFCYTPSRFGKKRKRYSFD
jgi:transglutaminase-like putative cysteine protease